ncbi:MAG TPA: prolyl oligopeptidase family serine peptidase [Planctomycetaceae bacterium]|nr:prolyl oligopeptidase family serine peptidase [Planctomycetaceae bacterium]HQZ64295.1 prolyl oligopeptidase family serine peptidase [Planctomycetaceae bacterium]
MVSSHVDKQWSLITWSSLATLLAAALSVFSHQACQAGDAPATQRGETISTLDAEVQPLLYWAPESATEQPTPLLVFLHSWSSDYQQDNSKWLDACQERNWIWLHPNFRGANQAPKACGSKYARQDVLDAIAFAGKRWNVDPQRVYLAGVSGGGHMALLMAGHHPDAFSAVSAWVAPTDLAEWHRFHTKNGKPQKYAVMIEKSLGGAPGASAAIDADYRDRSPVFHLDRVGDLPVSIWAGVDDGHSGSVPIRHSLTAFNAIAAAHGDSIISEIEIGELGTAKRLSAPQHSDEESDPALGTTLLLRRRSGESMITIFEGGHESHPASAMEWLSSKRRAVSTHW